MAVDAVRCPDSSDQESNKDCTYFTRTGCCSFGNDCKYRHDRSKILPLAGYTDNGYPLRPGCDVCTFYLSTGWCNHWFSCSKDHDISRLSGECRESLPPPTIMEQFHRFKYHSYTKEYKPLSSNHLPEAIRSKRWVVGNEYGQSSLPRSAQSRIMQSFKNGIPEELKNRLQSFNPNDANIRNMQLMRASMGGYLGALPNGALMPRLSVPQYGGALATPPTMIRPQVTNKVMTPVSAVVSQQQQVGFAAAAAGYQPNRIPAYSVEQKPIVQSPTLQRQDSRYYPMVAQAGQSYTSYSPVYQPSYSMDMTTVSMPTPTPATIPAPTPLASSPTYPYPPQTSPPPLLPLPQQPLVSGGAAQQSGYIEPTPTLYAQPVSSTYQQAQQYGQYMYGQGMPSYSVPLVMNYPQHGWSYGSPDNSGGIAEQEQQQHMLQTPAFKGQKMGEDEASMLQEDVEECLYNTESH